MEDLRDTLGQPHQQLHQRVEELRGVLRRHRPKYIKDCCRSKVPDLQLRWTAIHRAMNVVSYAPSGLWSVRMWESEKVLIDGLRGHWGGPEV